MPSARARTLSLDWRHGVVVALCVVTLLIVFTLAFNYATLKWAAAVKHPWLQAIVLADQREEAQRTQERIQGHLNAMAVKLGDLEAQVMRLDSLGDRLAGVAGLRPQELPAKGGDARAGRRGVDVDAVARPDRGRVRRRCSRASGATSTSAPTSSRSSKPS